MDYISADFGVDSSKHFPFRARTHTHTDVQSHRCNLLPYPLLGYCQHG